MTLRAPDPFSLPDAVVGKDSDNPVLIVIVVADVAVSGLQLFDRLDILEGDDLFFELSLFIVAACSYYLSLGFIRRRT